MELLCGGLSQISFHLFISVANWHVWIAQLPSDNMSSTVSITWPHLETDVRLCGVLFCLAHPHGNRYREDNPVEVTT